MSAEPALEAPPPPAYKYVDTDEDLAALVDELAAEPVYGLDTEFHRERTYYPRLGLLQVSWAGGIALVDPLAVDVGAFARVLARPAVAIIHAAEQDLEILEQACGALPGSLFDTQTAAGFLGMSSPSLVSLVERMLGLRLHKADQLTDWTRRPLSAGQLSYAASDVAHLLELRAMIAAELRRLGRLGWAEEEFAVALARSRRAGDPDEAWWRLKHSRQLRGTSRGVAQSVVAWRERRAQELDLPVRFVLPDLAVISIAQRPPRSRRDLEQARSIDNRHLGARSVEGLLEAVEEGTRLSREELRLPPVEQGDQGVRFAVPLAMAWVAQRAAELRIEPAILATRADIGGFLQPQPTGRLSGGWRHDLIGEPLQRLAAGALAVALDADGRLILEERSYRRVDGAGSLELSGEEVAGASTKSLTTLEPEK